MKNLILGLSILMSSAGFAAAADEDNNVFNADMSNPDLAAAIQSFETVCMPFVLHKTEMTRDNDKRHMAKLMQSRGFTFQTSVQETKRVLIEPKREPWKPARDDRERFKDIYDHNDKQNGKPKTTRGQFTIFNGVSNQVIPSVETIIKPQPGEIRGVQIPAKYRRVLIETETYGDLNEPRLSAHLGWNYLSQNHPGKSCEIRLDQPKIDTASFAADFIDKDTDWTPKDSAWTQCITEGEDQFKFTVSRTPQTLAISMIRNDFYAPELCVDS